MVIAEAANPEWVSVPLVGWSIAHALRDVADVHIVTQIRNQEAIMRAGFFPGKDFTAIDSETFAGPLWKGANVLRMGAGKGWTMTTAVTAISYLYFERLVWKHFGADIRAGTYDIVHRVTPLSPTVQSPIAAKCASAGVPFVVGPLNGGVPWPKGFDAERRREREWLSYVRSIYKLFPGRKKSLRASAAILVGSRHTQSEIPADLQDRTIYLPENAIDPSRFNLRATQRISRPLRACFIGRFVPYKGPDMILEAARPLLRDGCLKLDMVGDGPMRQDLEDQVRQDGLSEAVTFHGMLDHSDVQAVAVRSHLLAFPSIREFGGGVVLEAMSLGVVPVVVDYAGPGELVTPTTGFKIPIGPRAKIVTDLRDMLAAIVADPSALPEMAARARAHVHHNFTWSAKACQIAQVYDWAAQGRKNHPPQFF